MISKDHPYKKGDWVRLRHRPEEGPYLIEIVTDTCYHIDFGEGLEVTYDVEIIIDKSYMRELEINKILGK